MNTLLQTITVFVLVHTSISTYVIPEFNKMTHRIQIDSNGFMRKQLEQGRVPKANNQTFFHYKYDKKGTNHASYFRMDTCIDDNSTYTFYNETFGLQTYFQTFEDCKRKEFNKITKQYIFEIDWVGRYEDIPFKDVALHWSYITEDCSTFEEVQTFTLDSCARVNSEQTERYTIININRLVLNKFEGMECDQYIGYAEYYPIDECIKSNSGGSFYHKLTTNSSVMPFVLCAMIFLLLI